MKKMSFSIKSVLDIGSALFVNTGAGIPAFFRGAGEGTEDDHRSGSSSVTAAPTIAYVSIGVTTFNKNAATAQGEKTP